MTVRSGSGRRKASEKTKLVATKEAIVPTDRTILVRAHSVPNVFARKSSGCCARCKSPPRNASGHQNHEVDFRVNRYSQLGSNMTAYPAESTNAGIFSPETNSSRISEAMLEREKSLLGLRPGT